MYPSLVFCFLKEIIPNLEFSLDFVKVSVYILKIHLTNKNKDNEEENNEEIN